MTGEELFLSNYSFSLTETFSSHELYNLGELDESTAYFALFILYILVLKATKMKLKRQFV